MKQYKAGFEDNRLIRLRCYKGYQMERDLRDRILAVFGECVQPSFEISAFDGLVKGHPDFGFFGYPGDCKSVLMNDWLPEAGKLPRRVFFQMQSYMLYSGKDRALVIYETREGGLLRALWINKNERIQQQIAQTLARAVEMIRNG